MIGISKNSIESVGVLRENLYERWDNRDSRALLISLVFLFVQSSSYHVNYRTIFKLSIILWINKLTKDKVPWPRSRREFRIFRILNFSLMHKLFVGFFRIFIITDGKWEMKHFLARRTVGFSPNFPIPRLIFLNFSSFSRLNSIYSFKSPRISHDENLKNPHERTNERTISHIVRMIYTIVPG